ncbi:hypothetical protein BFP72_04080 [Reichenbachiella sp. 5M10]|uniref:response regulator n=1 Tax=Reichenbachiella sp. 5M10 TaxID=1889772 RepID=UPI000C161D30|nr:response regulator [Reichenbachiella sp. 5M10]PIB34645.1 hypothetical protein BFP72_04080 [Reichenbachiella sp. 5M10]
MYLLRNRPNQKKTVLLVDDNKMMCQLTTKILEKNFNVQPFQSAIDAIKWLSESAHKPHVVVTDITMSDMSGLEFGQYLQFNGLYSNIPLVYMSGIPESEVSSYPVSVNYSAYAQKPFCPETLLKTIERVTSQELPAVQA